MATFQKAERKKAKLRLGLVGPAGSGKTYSALLVAFGLGGKVALIDTENGSGDLYAHLGGYDVCRIEAPYTVKKYLDAIDAAEQAGYDVLIIDSLSHAWSGEGGLLDQHGKIADSSKNSYTAWRSVTPMHYKLVDAMLTSKCHIIATMRAKTEYSQEKDDRGKTVIRKLGMAPVQREGMDYEYTLVFDLDAHHNATASKDRTSLFDGQILTLSAKTGETLKEWLESGTEAPAPPRNDPPRQATAPEQSSQKEEKAQDTPPKGLGAAGRKKALYDGYLAVCNHPEHAKNAMLKAAGGKASKDWTEEDFQVLEADLKRRREEPAPESVRDVMPDVDFGDSVDLAEKMGIGPDPIDEAVNGF
jgi:hypothetical protein